MQNRFGLLDTDVMPIFMIIALDIFITMRFSINCSAVICSPTIIHAILREATSETNGPGSLFYYITSLFHYIASRLLFCNLYFPIYTTKIPKIFTLLSLLDLTFARHREGIDNPFMCWLQGSRLFVQVLGDLCVVSYWIDTLVCKTEGNTYGINRGSIVRKAAASARENQRMLKR